MIAIRHISIVNFMGGLSLSIITIILGILILPSKNSEANAESSENSTTMINITAEPTVSIALENQINMEFAPNKTSEFQSSSAKLKVSTNNTDGYKILLSTADETTDITNSASNGTIKSITGSNITPENFNDNSWGYSLTQVNQPKLYSAVPNTTTQVSYIPKVNPATNQADEYDLSFGIKLNNQLPAGIYQKQIVVSVIANPVELDNLQHTTYMHEMNTNICANTRGLDGSTTITPGNEPSKQLIDIRDGKKYWVSKLADQNCWMTQNLALDIKTNGWSTDTSDILNDAVSWANNNSRGIATDAVVYFPKATTTDFTIEKKRTSTDTDSFKLGDYILINQSNSTSCNVGYGGNITNCNFAQKIDHTWQDTLDASSNGYIAADTASKRYDSHYLIGNYYQYNTATAGSAGTLTNTTASSSICPKNWQLPSGDTGQKGSIAYLIDAYHTSENQLSQKPLYLTKAGNFMMASNGGGSTSSIVAYNMNFNQEGGYWSNAMSKENYKAKVYLTPSNSLSEINRAYAYSIRCLVK